MRVKQKGESLICKLQTTNFGQTLKINKKYISPQKSLLNFWGLIVKWCFWIQIKFITEDSKAIHTITTTIQLKLNEVTLIRKVFTTEEEAPSKLGLGFE